VAHVATVDDGLAPSAHDFLDDTARGRALAVARQVVDDHPRSVPRQFERVGAPQAAPRAGDDGNLVLQQLPHDFLSIENQDATAALPLRPSIARASAGVAISSDSSSRMRRILPTCSAHDWASWPLPR